MGIPVWLGHANFDLIAKVPKGTTPDQFCVMLQSMLVDRFKLEVHHEAKESAEYRLTVAKGGAKLRPAASKQASDAEDSGQSDSTEKPFHFDEAGYPTFTPGESGTKYTFNGRTRMHESRATMHRLAFMLSGYVHGTVTDATGLDGEYEIDLYWVLDSAVADGSPDDVSGPTLVQALQKELGLRLEKTANGTKDVLVVDHAERIPTAN